MKSDDEWPWCCQLLWASFGSPWSAEIEEPGCLLGRDKAQFAQRAGRRRAGQRHTAAPG